MLCRNFCDYHQKRDPPHKVKIFAKLIMEGPINSTLRYLADDGCIIPD